MASPMYSQSIVSTASSYSAYNGNFSEGVLDCARSILEGCTEDYYFFQSDENSYVLLVGDISFLPNGACSSSDCMVYDIQVTHTYTPHNNINHNQINGVFAGTQNGTFQGDYSYYNITYTEHDITFQVDVYPLSDYLDSISITNADHCFFYGSAENYPHLIEGVQNYAFAAFVLAFLCIGFRVSNRLFARCH